MDRVDKVVFKTLFKLGMKRERVSLNADFDEMGLEPIEILYLMNQVEQKLNISINDNDIPKLRNLENTLKYIRQRRLVAC